MRIKSLPGRSHVLITAVILCTIILLGFQTFTNSFAAPVTTRIAPQLKELKLIFFGWHNNTPANSAEIAFPGNAPRHRGAQGTGTYDDPVTLAADPGIWKPGTIFYIEYAGNFAIKKYFIMEDSCPTTICSPETLNLWLGNNGSELEAEAIACTATLEAASEAVQVEIHPSTEREVLATALFDGDTGTCITPGESSGVPSPSPETIPSPSPETIPSPSPAIIPSPSPEITIPSPPSFIVNPEGNEQQIDVHITGFGYPDNDPAGSKNIAYPILHQDGAGGTGTYEDPITFASADAFGEPGMIIYVVELKKYFIREDLCATCRDGEGGYDPTLWVDLWVESGPGSNDEAVLACEGALTRESAPIIINAEPGREVSPNPIFEDPSTCNVGNGT